MFTARNGLPRRLLSGREVGPGTTRTLLVKDEGGRDTARAVRAEEKERNKMMPLRSHLIYIARRPWVVKRFSGKSEPASKTQKNRPKKKGIHPPNPVGE